MKNNECKSETSVMFKTLFRYYCINENYDSKLICENYGTLPFLNVPPNAHM